MLLVAPHAVLLTLCSLLNHVDSMCPDQPVQIDGGFPESFRSTKTSIAQAACAANIRNVREQTR